MKAFLCPVWWSNETVYRLKEMHAWNAGKDITIKGMMSNVKYIFHDDEDASAFYLAFNDIATPCDIDYDDYDDGYK